MKKKELKLITANTYARKNMKTNSWLNNQNNKSFNQIYCANWKNNEKKILKKILKTENFFMF